jgi:hypothetical protein
MVQVRERELQESWRNMGKGGEKEEERVTESQGPYFLGEEQCELEFLLESKVKHIEKHLHGSSKIEGLFWMVFRSRRGAECASEGRLPALSFLAEKEDVALNPRFQASDPNFFAWFKRIVLTH